MTPLRSWFALLALVAAATIAFHFANVPSATLFGGLLGGLVYALAVPTPISVPAGGFRVAQGIIGTTVGAMIDWGSLKELGWNWPAVFAVCITTLLVSVAAGQLLRLHRGVSMSTAAFSSVAGGASGMTVLADEFGADDRVVTVLQYLRVLVVLMTLPIVISLTVHTSAGQTIAVQPTPAGGLGTLYTAIAIALGLGAGKLLRLPSPAVLGGIGAGALLALLPFFDDAGVPGWLRDAAFILIGAQVGLRFTRSTLRRIGRMMPTAFIVIAIIMAACALLGLALSELTGVSRVDGYLATTPGGLPAVLAATADTGGDITFVSTVQLLRILIVLICAPFLAHWLLRRRDGDG